ncbi:4941_t:CDS:1, partial [Scutellospora calospora]
ELRQCYREYKASQKVLKSKDNTYNISLPKQDNSYKEPNSEMCSHNAVNKTTNNIETTVCIVENKEIVGTEALPIELPQDRNSNLQ